MSIYFSAGTGGTLAGISAYLKEQDPTIAVALIDPPGSALFNKVKHGVLFAKEDTEGKRKKACCCYFSLKPVITPSQFQVDTITEGIGINNRLTANFQKAVVDHAFRGADREAVEMAHYLMRNDGKNPTLSFTKNNAQACSSGRRPR